MLLLPRLHDSIIYFPIIIMMLDIITPSLNDAIFMSVILYGCACYDCCCRLYHADIAMT